MGILISKQSNCIQTTSLITSIYCDHCKKSFLFNDYYKHIVQCKKSKNKNKNKSKKLLHSF